MIIVAIFIYCLLDALTGFLISKSLWALISPHLNILFCMVGSMMVLPMIKIGPISIPGGFGSDEIMLGAIISTVLIKLFSNKIKNSDKQLLYFLVVIFAGFLLGFIIIKTIGMILVSLSGIDNCLEQIPVVGIKWSWFDRAFWILTAVALINLIITVIRLWRKMKQ